LNKVWIVISWARHVFQASEKLESLMSGEERRGEEEANGEEMLCPTNGSNGSNY
jgi:hypothetical protein